MDPPNTVNIENSEIGVLLELSDMNFILKKEIKMSLTIIDVKWKIRCIWFYLILFQYYFYFLVWREGVEW